MKSGNYYPSLGRYFRNQTELAHAGCMSRTRLWECLTGQKNFVLCANILKAKTLDIVVIS